MENCPHREFQVRAEIARMEDKGLFNASITIHCTVCDVPFAFVGLPAGLHLWGAAVSPDGTEGRFAIEPTEDRPLNVS